ncbi:MAG: DUF4159 domain-containing protein [Kiritimatiellaeota bacterium]|nr:DUF4159 domain-containing protein [Kiritimatiellota bacterium]
MNIEDTTAKIERITRQAIDWTCGWVAWVHRALAKGLGGAIGVAWGRQAPWSLPPKFMLGFWLLGLFSAFFAWFIPEGYIGWAYISEANVRLLERNGILEWAEQMQWFFLAVAALCAVAGVASWIRRGWVMWIQKAAVAAWGVAWIMAMRWGLSAPAILNAMDFRMFGKEMKNALWTVALAHGVAILVVPALVILGIALVSTRKWYRREAEAGDAQWGDQLVASLKTGGRDPRWRSSMYWSSGLWFTVLVLPFLMRGGCGWETPYDIPIGEMEEEQQVVHVKKPPKKQQFIVSAYSPVIWERITVDEIKVMQEILLDTMATYVADNSQAAAGTGKKPGRKGWPNGMENAKVRFIRLKYGGGNWDLVMGKGGDYNMLVKFNQMTGFGIARDTEAIDIGRLQRFPKRKAPPFVYLTGSGNVNLTESDVKALRWYLEEEGGMLFISNGGRHFGNSARAMLNRVLPGSHLIDISNDDPIYKYPYVFPNGAPALWPHDGNRCLGIKIDGRWAVFYHPGDIGDAWKDGHSGAAPEIADQAYKLGVNLMYYSFTAYYRRHFTDGEEMSK